MHSCFSSKLPTSGIPDHNLPDTKYMEGIPARRLRDKNSGVNIGENGARSWPTGIYLKLCPSWPMQTLGVGKYFGAFRHTPTFSLPPPSNNLNFD
ncbi:hypothetical protein CEXT_155341 [Caerostris extrusa]|uniref:Uncharacterized protein n=1 Tax=Caerostris extrusa TaxID=172846 RepID=A0AAV4SJH8_CAEEX|nr:hypothetical protein CEXT_155341 [Caerostris extrusa]